MKTKLFAAMAVLVAAAMTGCAGQRKLKLLPVSTWKILTLQLLLVRISIVMHVAAG